MSNTTKAVSAAAGVMAFVVGFPALWVINSKQDERAARQTEQIIADLVSYDAETRRQARSRYTDVTRKAVAEKIYTTLIENSRRADRLPEEGRAILVDALAFTPAHYAYVNTEKQAVLLGQELSEVGSRTQAALILDVLVSKDLIRHPATTNVVCEFIRRTDSRAISYGNKGVLIGRLLVRLGFVSKAFVLHRQEGLYRSLDHGQQVALANALKQHLANSVSADDATQVIHRELSSDLSDALDEELKAGVSTDRATGLINHAIGILDEL